MLPSLRGFFLRFGRQAPAAAALLFESKNVSTHRGPSADKRQYAVVNRAWMPDFSQAARAANQSARYRLQNKLGDFQAAATAKIHGLLRGEAGVRDVKELKSQLRSLYHDAYSLGVGGSAAGLRHDWDAASPEDKRWVDSAATHEMRYFNNFLAQIVDGELDPAQINRRLNMYLNTVRGVYDAGRVIGAHPYSLIYWIYHPEAQHCTSCLYLRDHSPFTKNTLPTTPRAGATECLSNCKCHLRFVQSDKDIIRQTEAASLSRATHLTYLNSLQTRRGRGRRRVSVRRPSL